MIGFQIRSGGRFALLELAPVFGLLAGVVAFMGPGFVQSLAAALFPDDASQWLRAWPRMSLEPVLLVAPFFAAASAARSRLLPGAYGWMEHLPVSPLDLRRALGLALTVSNAPTLLSMVVLRLIREGVGGGAPAVLVVSVSLLQFLIVAVAVAYAVLPVRRSARLLAALCGLLAMTGLPGAVLGVVGLLVSERLSGGLRPRRSISSWEPRAQSLNARRPLVPLPIAIALRALPGRSWLALPAALLPLGACALFLANNELELVHQRGAARLAVGIAITALLATVCESIWKHRPVDRFVRSLPWSSKRRVAYDAGLLFVVSLPVVLVYASVFPRTAPTALALSAVLAVRGSGHLRAPLKLGPGSAVWLEGTLSSGLVALLPWLWIPMLVGLPFLWQRAAERERNQTTAVVTAARGAASA
jgi:hypothetical protein